MPPTPVSHYRKWIDERKDPPDRKQIAYAALDAYELLAEQTLIKAHELIPIITAAKSPYLFAWDIGTELLMRLAESNHTAQDAIREIFFSACKAKERFQMLASIRHGLPEKLYIEIIRRALDDKSYRVRQKAAEAADRLYLKQLLPDLEARLYKEEHPKARQSLAMHVAMLRDGPLLERDKDGNPQLTVRTKNGWASPHMTRKEIDDNELDNKIQEIRSKDYY